MKGHPALRYIGVRWLVILTILVGLASPSGGIDAAGPEPSADAKFFAAMLGVDVSEAVRRLELQRAAGALESTLVQQEATHFAGLWLEQHPQFKVVVAFTRDGDSILKRYIAGTNLETVAEARVTTHTTVALRDQLRSLLWLAREGIANLGTSVQENRIIVRVVSRAQLDQALTARGVELPAAAKVVLVPSLPKPAADIYGGLALDGGDACTSGFGIEQWNTGERGVTTAGHCANSLTYAGSNLAFQSERVGGGHDEQWHLAPGFQVRNWVKDGVSPTRQITSRTNSANTPIGALACKYGRNTGFGCGYISEKDNTGCVGGGGPFIYVQSQGIDLVQGGDSGGPVFVDNSAYGVISCEAPAGGIHMIYAAVENVELGLGVTVLTAP